MLYHYLAEITLPHLLVEISGEKKEKLGYDSRQLH